MPVRAALFSYFELDDLTRLMNAIAGSGMPAGRACTSGRYGVNREASTTVHTYGPGPLLTDVQGRGSRPRPGSGARSRPRRSARSAGDSRDASRTRPHCSASRPPSARLGASRSAAATATRSATRAPPGSRSTSWQLDELGTQLAGPQGRQHREFVRGVLQGMTFGRRVLGDSERKGWVWATRRALNLARLPVTAELRAFWQQLDRAAFRVVGEEFPNFVGDPARAARTQADGRRALAAGGPVRRAARRPLRRGDDTRVQDRARPRRQRRGPLPRRGQPLAQRVRRRAEQDRRRRASASSTSCSRTAARWSCVDASRAVARGMAGL